MKQILLIPDHPTVSRIMDGFHFIIKNNIFSIYNAYFLWECSFI